MPLHWTEYAIEAFGLGAFMVSATLFTALLEHPASPGRRAIRSSFARRALIGAAMGLTAIALIYSPWGKRSGAHLNPSVTLTFLRLHKIELADALGYVIAQCIGGALGVLLVARLLPRIVADPAVGFVVTTPGARGLRAAFVAEAAISFLMMSVVLASSSTPATEPATGVFAGTLVALFITFEAPVSGMSMNPARTFASAIVARRWRGFWIYLLAPLAGMLLAAELRVHLSTAQMPCAKLRHDTTVPCLFCGETPLPSDEVHSSDDAHAAGG